MRNYIEPGENLAIVAAAALTAGQALLIDALFGVVQETVAIGETVTLVRRGVFTLPKLAAQAWAVGQKVYWDDANSRCTTVASGNVLVGVAVQAAANPSDDGAVLLDGTVR